MYPYTNPRVVLCLSYHRSNAFSFYIIPYDVNTNQHTLVKTISIMLSYGWPHAEITRWCLLWCFVLNYVHAPPVARAVTAISQRRKTNHDGKHNQLNWRKVMNGNKMSYDHWIVYKWHQTMLNFIVYFSINSPPRWRCNAGTDAPRPHDHTPQSRRVVRNVRHWIPGCGLTIDWKCDAWMQNRLIKSSTALWELLPCLSHRCFLQLAKNKMIQLLVTGKRF